MFIMRSARCSYLYIFVTLGEVLTNCVNFSLNREVEFSHYDKYLIAATALYIAGKVADDYKLRDVINVSHYTLHKNILDLKVCG